MNDSIVIKIESGVVAEIFSTSPVQVTIVDYDMIEGGETYERRKKKAVISMASEQLIDQEHIPELVKSLLLECRRPADLVPLSLVKEEVETIV